MLSAKLYFVCLSKSTFNIYNYKTAKDDDSCNVTH